MNCSPNGSESGLVGYWDFEEGTGNTALDQTSNGNNGTINGATYDANVPSQSCQLTNSSGCDSVAVLNLTINIPDTSYTNITTCDSLLWNGITYDSSGTYSYSLGSSSNITGFTFEGNYNGSNYYLSEIPGSWTEADSICNANGGHLVTISDSIENNFIYSISSEYYIWIGLYQNLNSPTFSEPIGGWEWVTGESLNYTNWNSNEPNNGGVFNEENNALMYSSSTNNPGSWNDAYDTDDTNYTPENQNIYFVMEIPQVSTNSNGCDSVAVLNLTINQADTSYTNVTTCDSYLWDGVTYTTSGSYSNTYTNALGCDSIHILNLTINQSDTSYSNITACDSATWNGLTYTNTGTYSTNVGSNNNYSINFDGNDNIQFSPSSLPSGNNEVTISTWVYRDSNTNSIEYVLGYGSPVTFGGMFAMGIYGNQGIFASFNGSAFDVISNYSLPTNSWQYLTAIHKQNGLVEIYLNANLIYTHQVSTPNINLTNGYIGVAPWGSSYWNGKIDNSSIWDRALSQQEIQQYMNCPPTGSELGLVGYWNFEEGSGNTVFDRTNNGNNGTINGASYNTNVPLQLCNLTNINGCDSVAVLNLTIGNYGCTDSLAINYDPFASCDDNSCNYCNNDTSYTNITSCDSFTWNGNTYNQTGLFYYSGDTSIVNNYSMNFDGVDDYIQLQNPPFNGVQNIFSIATSFKLDYLSNYTSNYDHCLYGHRGYYNDVQLSIWQGKFNLTFLQELVTMFL